MINNNGEEQNMQDVAKLTNNILSDITVYMKYARYIPEIQRRETWEELVERNMVMHIRKYPEIKEEIKQVYKDYVFNKKVLPSMRSLQFAGKSIETAPSRIFNCAFVAVDSIYAFNEAMFLLLGGTGLGFSVQQHHVEKLPTVKKLLKTKRRFLVSDCIEGWGDAVKVLMEAYFHGKSEPVFDYRDIRPKGAMLVTSGGKAPGPQPLKDAIHNIRKVLDTKAPGEQLTPLEAHDIMCFIADAVLAGGIRRAALVSLFSFGDEEMLTCKSGAWWELNPQRGRANNSVVLMRNKIKEDEFKELWKKVEASGAGEPGVFFTNDKEYGSNPCMEISLHSGQMCNLTEINVSDISSQEDLNNRAKAAAFIGTLQAGYTDFHYLRDFWKKTTEKEALIGVGMTGIGSGVILNYDLKQAAKAVIGENKRVASLIGINPAARTTTIKPSGTSSLVLGCSSGVHAWHNDYYTRRIRVGKNESIYGYLAEHHPALVEDEYFRPKEQAVIQVPQAAPEGSILRTEPPADLLERVKKFNLDWVREGHLKGQNTHNVSCTISVKDEEWAEVGEWMWENRNNFNGISVLPYDGGTYIQAPFEDISKDKFEEMLTHLTNVDLSKIIEIDDNTNLAGEVACGASGCEVK